MIEKLVPLFIVLAVASAVYIYRELRRRRRQVRPRDPGITPDEAWEEWRRSARPPVDANVFPAAGPVAVLPPELIQDTRAEFLRLTGLANREPIPRAAIQRIQLEVASTALHLEAVLDLGDQERALLLEGYDPAMEALLARALLQTTTLLQALRFFSAIKYDAANREDWLQNFVWLARPYIREKARLAREYLLRQDSGAGRFAAVYDQIIQELMEAMGRAHVKRRFVPPDLPIVPSPRTKRAGDLAAPPGAH